MCYSYYWVYREAIIIKGKKLLLVTFFILIFSLITNVNKVKAASSINDYIISNKIQPAAIQNREGTFNVWSGYRYGVGHPEGVVVHETSENNVTAEQFVQRFNANWPTLETYVHAFVDNNNVINIHNTDYTVWGAGPIANSRYIQVELCRVDSYDAFARSLSNDANYIASKLIQYNLPDVPGTTVLSHQQTSAMWHETDHTDPTHYFDTWGYNMDQFNDLISYYYNNQKTYGNIYGQSKNTIRVKNNLESYVPLVSFSNDGVATEIKDRALANGSSWYTDETKDYNGVTFHRVSTNEWVADSYKY